MNSGNVIFYVDGVAEPAIKYNPQFTFTTGAGIEAAIGMPGDSIQTAPATDFAFWGTIDELAIYNQPLSASEIQNIYLAGSYGKCPQSTPPIILSQPTNAIVLPGDSVTFAVNSLGTEPILYQWRIGGTNILYATNSTLTISNVQPSQAGTYTVVVTNNYGSLISSNAVLNVAQSPLFVTEPMSQIVALNSNATLFATGSWNSSTTISMDVRWNQHLSSDRTDLRIAVQECANQLTNRHLPPHGL